MARIKPFISFRRICNVYLLTRLGVALIKYGARDENTSLAPLEFVHEQPCFVRTVEYLGHTYFVLVEK